jgi:hypothetical protein
MKWLDVDARGGGEMSPSCQRPKELCLVGSGSAGTEVARWGRRRSGTTVESGRQRADLGAERSGGYGEEIRLAEGVIYFI